MLTLNKVELLGYCGDDPEIRTTQGGKEIVTFSLGVADKVKDHKSGEYNTETSWFRVTVTNTKLSAIAKQYIQKGTRVFVMGSLKTTKYVNKQGVDTYSTEIVLSNTALLQFENKKDQNIAADKEQEVVETKKEKKA